MENILDSLIRFFRQYKIPVVLSIIGIFMLALSAVMLIRESVSTPEIVFTESASSSAKLAVQVDVQGAIMRPGVYKIPEDARIADVLSLAGGLSKEADLEWMEKYLNRAAKVADGGKIYIPKAGENQVQNPNSKIQITNSDVQNNLLGVSEGKVNINTCTVGELDALPGIGEVISGKIISGRPYATLEELKTKKAVGNALFEKIKDLITVD